MRRSTILYLLSVTLLSCAAENETLPTEHEPYDGGAAIPLACLPNLDGVVESHELAPTLGQDASFIVTPPLPQTATERHLRQHRGSGQRRGAPNLGLVARRPFALGGEDQSGTT